MYRFPAPQAGQGEHRNEHQTEECHRRARARTHVPGGNEARGRAHRAASIPVPLQGGRRLHLHEPGNVRAGADSTRPRHRR